MEQSIFLPSNRNLAIPSPTHPLLAVASGNVLDVYDIHTLSLLHSTPTSSPIAHVCWSCKSCSAGPLVALSSRPSNTLLVLQAESGQALLDLHESILPISHIQLHPPYLLVLSSHSLLVSVYHLPSATLHARLPFPSPQCLPFALSRSYILASVHQVKTRRSLHLQPLSSSRHGHHISLDSLPLSSIRGLLWIDSSRLLLYGSPHDAHGSDALVVLTHKGQLACAGNPERTDCYRYGRGERIYSGMRTSGIEIVRECKGMLGIGYSGWSVRIVETTGWTVLSGYDAKHLDTGTGCAEMYVETISEDKSRGFQVERVEQGRVCVGGVRGKGKWIMEWEKGGRWLGSVDGGNVVTIWDGMKGGVRSVIVCKERIKGIGWGEEGMLGIVTGGGWVYVWREGGMVTGEVGGKGEGVKWGKGGMIVDGGNGCVVVYVGVEDEKVMREMV